MGEEAKIEGQADRIDREAAEWAVRLRDDASERTNREYAEWLARDERHQQRAEFYAGLRSDFKSLAAMMLKEGETRDADNFDRLDSDSVRRILPKWLWPGSLAALAACLAVAFFLDEPFSDDSLVFVDTLVAERFERRFLPDGSLLELNAGAEAEVDFDGNERRIRLVDGEVYFSVVPDPSRPFVVHASEVTFRAIGTAFNVRFGDDEVELLVTEGRVGVEAAKQADANAADVPLNFIEEAVAANHRVTLSIDSQLLSPSIERLEPLAIESRLAWKHELLEFVSTPLTEVIKAFNQRNRDQIEIADPALGGERIDGVFRSDNLVGFIDVIEIMGQVKTDRSQPGKIVLRPRSE